MKDFELKFERILPELKNIIYKYIHTFKMKYIYKELIRKTCDIADFLEKYECLTEKYIKLEADFVSFQGIQHFVRYIDCVWIKFSRKFDKWWCIIYSGHDFEEEPQEIRALFLSNMKYNATLHQ